jgi:uncharacterized protein YfiM (DUF2279 family)
MKIPNLPADKAQHMVYGAVASAIGAALAWQSHAPLWAGALGLALVVGVAKEAWDCHEGTAPSVADIAATLAGALPAALAGWLAGVAP